MGSTISSIVFQPPVCPTYNHNLPPFNHRVKIINNSRTIPAFYIARDTARYTIILSHGNAEDLGMIYNWLEVVSYECNVSIFAYEYSGYDTSDVSPTEQSVFNDIESAFAYCTSTLNIPPCRIILYGRSLGSGPTCYLASKISVAGVILQSPVLSIYRVAFPFRFSLFRDMFCNIDVMRFIVCPVTIIHGTIDEVVPFYHGESLFNATLREWRCKPLWIVNGGHNNLEALTHLNSVNSGKADAFISHIAEFVTTCHKVVEFTKTSDT